MASQWYGLLIDFQNGFLLVPCRIVADGHAGLHSVLDAWFGVRVQRCTKHKLANDAFIGKWSKLCPAVARSLEEAGHELLTAYESPKAMWRSLRTNNPLERINREFRRRTKTQASFGQEASTVTLLYGLVALGQIRMRTMDGHRQLKALVAKMSFPAA